MLKIKYEFFNKRRIQIQVIILGILYKKVTVHHFSKEFDVSKNIICYFIMYLYLFFGGKNKDYNKIMFILFNP